MMSYFTHRIGHIAVISAAVCFLFGTLLLMVLLAFHTDVLVGLGIAFVVFSALVNAFILLGLFVTLFVHPKDIEQNVLAIVLLLLNYPIAVLYVYFLS